MQFRKLLTFLLVGAILLPVLILPLAGVGRLLAAMQDAGGALLLDRLTLLLGLLWVADLVALLLVLAARVISQEADTRVERRDD